MMNRTDMITLIEQVGTPELWSEIRYHCDDIEREEDGVTFDELSAIFDVEERAEEWKNRGLLTACRRTLIAIGFYRVMTDHEVANTITTSGTVWAFKLDGVPYTSDFNQYAWMWAEEGWQQAA